MPTRSRPPASRPPRKGAGKPAKPPAAAKKSTAVQPSVTTKPPASPTPTARATRPARARPPATPKPPARAKPPATAVRTTGPARPAEPARPKVQRTCYEVRLMVCPRDPATCGETWPLGQRLLCGSFQMLARFEKESGGEDLEAEAGLADALAGLTIRNRPDADPDEAQDDDDGDEER